MTLASLDPGFRLGASPEQMLSALEAYNWRAYHRQYQRVWRRAHGKQYLQWHATYAKDRRCTSS